MCGVWLLSAQLVSVSLLTTPLLCHLYQVRIIMDTQCTSCTSLTMVQWFQALLQSLSASSMIVDCFTTIMIAIVIMIAATCLSSTLPHSTTVTTAVPSVPSVPSPSKSSLPTTATSKACKFTVCVYLVYSIHSTFLWISLDLHCSRCDSLNVNISCAWNCTNILAMEDMEEDTHNML